MPKGFGAKYLVPLEAIRPIHIDRILAMFGIPSEGVLTRCPFHDDEQASMQINDTWVYCHGCNKSWDNFAFVRDMLIQQGKRATFDAVLDWFTDHIDDLPASSFTEREKAEYVGPVDPFLVNYWHDCIQANGHIEHLMQERLLTEETISRYKLGWRPDMYAWSIPFWRGLPGESEVDILQFRHTKPSKTKYTGLLGRNRASVMNAHLLSEPQEYVIILFGTFDPILALQDGLPAVGFNGASHFVSRDKERLLEMFAKQTRIYIVPDNQPEELKHAKQLRNVLGEHRTSIRTFPEECADKEDYISYRHKYTVEDFLIDVLRIKPIRSVNEQLVINLYELLRVGDGYDLAPLHLSFHQGTVVADVARSLAYQKRFDNYSPESWVALQDDFCSVRCLEEFESVYKKWANHSYTLLGGW